MDQPGTVANPPRGQLNMENEYSLGTPRGVRMSNLHRYQKLKGRTGEYRQEDSSRGTTVVQVVVARIATLQYVVVVGGISNSAR